MIHDYIRQFLLFWGRTKGLSTVLYTQMGITPHSIEGISSCALMGYVDHILISLFTILYIYSIIPSMSDLSYKAYFRTTSEICGISRQMVIVSAQPCIL